MQPPKTNLSSLLGAAEDGDGSAAGALFDVLYQELRRLAARQLARSGVSSLSPTTLLHEAYLDMAEREGNLFPDEAHFLGYAARVMRGLIIDHARNRCAIKRGGQFEITSADTQQLESAVDPRELSRVSDALDELAKVDLSLCELVDLKFFCGFSFAEIAAIRAQSERTVQRKWEQARIYLYHSLAKNPGAER